MVSFTVVLLVVAQFGAARANDFIDFPSTLYVKPGDEFELKCGTDGVGIVEPIYTPGEAMPSDEKFRKKSLRKSDHAFTHEQGAYLIDFVDANKADHAGIYTCVVFRQTEPVVVKATCEVIVEDLCKDVVCPEPKTCVADYKTGATSCQCVFDCPTTGFGIEDFICTDHCETMAHECEMNERNCLEGEDRKVWRSGGFCPFPYNAAPKPKVNILKEEQPIRPDVGEEVTLDSGITEDGTPPAEITWTVNFDEVPEFKNQRKYVFTATDDMDAYVVCKIVHCRKEDDAIYNKYHVKTRVEPTSTTETTTFADKDINETPEIYPVCSLYPGGAIEQFNTAAAFYDMACTHVLAADFSPDGDYTQSWFVYGTFDQHDGNTALMAMTMFVGGTAFEFQRGWLINRNGEKVPVEEGVPQNVGDCEVTFIGLHLRAACPHFYVYYDGIMSGHIRLGNSGTAISSTEPVKGYTNVGLCWDNRSGFRPNWQVATPSGCEVDTEKQKCQDSSECKEFEWQPYNINLVPWYFKALGSRQSCKELNCEGQTPTEAQECALNQADRVNQHLRKHKELTEKVDGGACPEDECDWKLDLLSRGCPQENPPFQC